MTSNIDTLFEQLLTTLQVAEKRHRVIRDSASDISDWDTYDREGELIARIIKWRRSLEPVCAEIAASGAIDDADISSLSESNADKPLLLTGKLINATPASEEELKIGKHIQTKLCELSDSGFVFTQEQILHMCDLHWSRNTFTYDRFLPFAKIANTQQDISQQTKDDSGRNRYWNRIFLFGDVPLLIMSQWYAKDKESFDKWFEGLTHTLPSIESNKVVFRKTVDWSTLNYGISVPVAHWESFFRAIGQTVAIGDSCNISIEINNNELGAYKASVIHTASGATNVLQIRYTHASEIAAELRRIFKNTFDYCNSERSLYGDNTRVLIPVDHEEYINICSNGTPYTLRFICSPIAKVTTLKEDFVQSQSILVHAKQRFNGDNIVNVSTSFVPILSFPESNTIISAKLNVETRQVLFRSEVLGELFPEKALDIEYLKNIAFLESSKRIHRVVVPEKVNASKLMMFMAWIEPEYVNKSDKKQEASFHAIEQTEINTRPIKMTLLGKEYTINTWREIYIKICEVMSLHAPYIIASLDTDANLNTEHRRYFSYIQSDIKENGKRLSNGLWIETDINYQEAEELGRKVIQKCGFSPDELYIETMEVV